MTFFFSCLDLDQYSLYTPIGSIKKDSLKKIITGSKAKHILCQFLLLIPLNRFLSPFLLSPFFSFIPFSLFSFSSLNLTSEAKLSVNIFDFADLQPDLRRPDVGPTRRSGPARRCRRGGWCPCAGRSPSPTHSTTCTMFTVQCVLYSKNYERKGVGCVHVREGVISNTLQCVHLTIMCTNNNVYCTVCTVQYV